MPATLKDSLMARLDRLGEAREVAQIAAVVGRQFRLRCSMQLCPEAPTLEAALANLVAAGIVFPEGRGLERSFSFKHALLRDAAYESLLLARRREWHERTARAVEQHFAELAASEPEVLAYHFGEAGLPAPLAITACAPAIRRSSRSAYQEAIAHFSAGLKLAEALPAEAGMRRQLDFLLKFGPALMVAPACKAPRRRTPIAAPARSARAGRRPETFQAKWGLWINANLRRKTALARDRASELVTLAQHSGDGDLLLEAYHCHWSTAFFRGDVADALDDCRSVSSSMT